MKSKLLTLIGSGLIGLTFVRYYSENKKNNNTWLTKIAKSQNR